MAQGAHAIDRHAVILHLFFAPDVIQLLDRLVLLLVADAAGEFDLALLGAGGLLRHRALGAPGVFRGLALVDMLAAERAGHADDARLGAGRLFQYVRIVIVQLVRVRVDRDDVRVLLRIVAARALVLRIALGLAGRRHHGRYHVVAQRRHLDRPLRTALAAGVHGFARLGAGRRRAVLLVLHPLVLGHLAKPRELLIGLAAVLAGVQHVLAFAVVN